jgi:hypothetical protein
MFSNLLDFARKRTRLQALGFYIAYLILLILFSSVVGAVMAMAYPASNTFEAGLRIGSMIAVLVSLLLATLVVIKKKRSDFLSLLLVPVSGVLAVLGGGIFGLIPVAYLTTKEKGK